MPKDGYGLRRSRCTRASRHKARARSRSTLYALSTILDEGSEGEPVIYIDDHALSLQEFGGLLHTYAGWGMRSRSSKTTTAILRSLRELENGKAAYEWR
jgi:hypothetical protein